jgi:hypothetical protein
MEFVNKKHLYLAYDEDLQAIIQVWKGFFTSELFREGVNKTNELFAMKKPVTKFLVDISESSVIKKEDTEWAATNAIPTAIKNGLKYYGFVLPSNVFAQVSLNNFRKDLNQPSLEVQIFASLERAKDWAKELDS